MRHEQRKKTKVYGEQRTERRTSEKEREKLRHIGKEYRGTEQ